MMLLTFCFWSSVPSVASSADAFAPVSGYVSNSVLDSKVGSGRTESLAANFDHGAVGLDDYAVVLEVV